MEDKKDINVAIIGPGETGKLAAQALANKEFIRPLPENEFDGMARVVEPTRTKEEELKGVDPKLQEAYGKLSESDKIMLQRGYMTFKKSGGEFKLVENIPFMPKTRGPKFTPKKKKRKK